MYYEPSQEEAYPATPSLSENPPGPGKSLGVYSLKTGIGAEHSTRRTPKKILARVAIFVYRKQTSTEEIMCERGNPSSELRTEGMLLVKDRSTRSAVWNLSLNGTKSGFESRATESKPCELSDDAPPDVINVHRHGRDRRIAIGNQR